MRTRNQLCQTNVWYHHSTLFHLEIQTNSDRELRELSSIAFFKIKHDLFFVALILLTSFWIKIDNSPCERTDISAETASLVVAILHYVGELTAEVPSILCLVRRTGPSLLVGAWLAPHYTGTEVRRMSDADAVSYLNRTTVHVIGYES